MRHLFNLLLKKNPVKKKLSDIIRPVEGDIVECDIGEGGSFLDWFEGFPEPTHEDARPAGQIDGCFENSLHKYNGNKIALLHIDADLYRSYKTVLNALYDKVAPGGVIAFDEYSSEADHLKWPGAQKAIDEFFSEKTIQILKDRDYGKTYAVKP